MSQKAPRLSGVHVSEGPPSEAIVLGHVCNRTRRGSDLCLIRTQFDLGENQSGEMTLKLVNGQYQKVDQAQDMKDLKDLVILRKTLQLNFFIRGDEVYPGEDEVNQKDEEWIMR